MQPSPISETSGPFGPSVRDFIALPSRLSCCRPFDCPCLAQISCVSVFPLNLPNVLTVLRIMLVPVLVVALLGNTPAGDVLAAVVFALASLTDFIDGYLARSRDSVTNFGKLMDPLADKLLIVAALIALVSLQRLSAWIAMVIITRELAVTVVRMGAASQFGVVAGANMLGKVKTCLQI